MPEPSAIHRLELRRLAVFGGSCVALAALTYVLPRAEAVQPWVPGERIPLVHLLQRDRVVQEDAQGELVVVDVEVEATPVEALPSDEGGAAAGPVLPRHPPAVPQLLEVPPGALDSWFAALDAVESGQPGAMARALHWGDSTIAADGLVRTVRARLQDRFGDGGPGFLAVQVDPRWAVRPEVARWPKGAWETLTITFGGAEKPYYGLAGTVSTAAGEAKSTLGGWKREDVRQPLHRFDVFYQVQPGGGTLRIKPQGAAGAAVSTDASYVGDRFVALDAPDGAPYLRVWVDPDDGPVSVYGVALETAGPGVVWDNLGVAGSGQGSMLSQGRKHMARQVERRDPDLLVYLTGGNELTYPSLVNGDGSKYTETYRMVLQRLKAGAPDASCLVVSPLDQAERHRGEVRSKPTLAKAIQRQRIAAYEEGCAFWDAQAAMGGDGSLGRWLKHDPPLAWTDLIHLTDEGLELVGDTFSDAMLAAYEQWQAEHEAEGIGMDAPQAGEDVDG